MIEIHDTKLEDVKRISLDPFEDFRGEYVMTWNEEVYRKMLNESLGKDLHFVEDDISTGEMRGVLKGVHGDDRTWKLISCLYGKFYLAVVNNNPESPQFREWQGFTLSDKNRDQILVPPKFGNGHIVLSNFSIFQYKQTSSYSDGSNQFTIRPDDPEYNIWWPNIPKILSQRDEQGHRV